MFKKRTKPDRFLTIQTDLSTYCNLRCKMCYFHEDKDFKKERVTFEQFDKLFSSFAGKIKTLGLSCATEPLLAREEDLFRILEYVKQKRIPQSNIVTNATLLNKRIAEKIIDCGISTLVISIDSHIKEKYETIRVGAKFERVVNNVKYLIDYRNSKRAETPFIQVNCVLGRYNIEDAPGYLNFLYRLGVEGVDFRHIVMHEGCGLYDQPLNQYTTLSNLYFDYIRERCKKLGIRLQFLPDNFREEAITHEESGHVKGIIPPPPDGEIPPRFPRGHMIGGEEMEPAREKAPTPVEGASPVSSDLPASGEEVTDGASASETDALPEPSGRKCNIPLSFMQVRPNGDVLPCCYWYGEKPVGNLMESDFETLWNEEEYEKLRREVSKGILIRHCCKNCPSLGSGSVNEEGGFEEKSGTEHRK